MPVFLITQGKAKINTENERKQKMNTIFLDIEQNKNPKTININDDLDTYYKLINCSTIDIVQRKINGHTVNIVCDDEGLFKSEPKISAINKKTFEPELVGNLIITGLADEDGNLQGIEKETQKDILENIKPLIIQNKISRILLID